MSLISRQREENKRNLWLRCGHATWNAFFVAQEAARIKWLADPVLVEAARFQLETALLRDGYGRVSQPPRRFVDEFKRVMLPMIYPEPVNDSL